MTRTSSRIRNANANKYAKKPTLRPIVNIESMPPKVEISEGVKKYLGELLQTHNSELKRDIENLQLKLDVKNKLIEELNYKVIDVVQRNVQLADELKLARENCEEKIDNLEQYTRKDSLRIEGIDYADDETPQALGTKIVKALKSIGAKVSVGDFHRYHRSGPSRTLSDGRTVSQTIVRFNNWAARKSSIEASQKGTRAERQSRHQHVKVDITKRRLALLKKAQSALRDHPIAHAYANNECALKVKNRRDKREFSFNNDATLTEMLANLPDYPIMLDLSTADISINTTTACNLIG